LNSTGHRATIAVKTVKMSLANLQGKMSRKEMKNIMAGSGGCNNKICHSDTDCCSEFPKCAPIPNWAGTSACAYNNR